MSQDQIESYSKQYANSIQPRYWSGIAMKILSWNKPFTLESCGEFANGTSKWFVDGELNACYNAVDRHIPLKGDNIALIYEADDPIDGYKITYKQLLENTCRVANWLKSQNLKKGDVVAICMPSIPQAVYSMLACARLGIIHNFIFSGFGPEAVSQRINFSNAKVCITSNVCLRGGKRIGLNDIIDLAIKNTPGLDSVLVYEREDNISQEYYKKPIYRFWSKEIPPQSPVCEFEVVSAVDPLFHLYTSGSTGAPKGIVHSTAGYLVYAIHTLKKAFNIKPEDRFGCMADLGWITGHSYVVYGPLCLGISTVIFESLPTFPTPARYWQTVEKYKLTQAYLSPTVIRLLQTNEAKYYENHDLSSLRSVGAVGESLHDNIWRWIYEKIGKKNILVIDTYWQTETGGIVICPPNIDDRPTQKPANLPFYGIDVDCIRNKIGESNGGPLIIRRPWPGLCIGIINEPSQFYSKYFTQHPGAYYAGDGMKYEGRYCKIIGRIDDVLNVCGHRLGAAEIETKLNECAVCEQAVVVAEPHEIAGEAICAFITTKSQDSHDAILKQLNMHLRETIGPIAAIKRLVICNELPKTRTGKVVRRLLKHIVNNIHEPFAEIMNTCGDLSTLENPAIAIDIVKSTLAS